MAELGGVDVRHEADLVRAHQTTRTIAAQLGFSSFEQTRIATAMTEIARNALVYAGGGTVSLEIDDDRQALTLVVTDRGQGITDPDVVHGIKGSSHGSGRGIPGARRLMAEVSIDTGSTGTRVVMSKRLPRRGRFPDAGEMGKMRQQVAEHLATDPFAELRRLQLDVAERDEKLAELSQELQETNRGVMALHAELDERAEYLRQAAELKTRLMSEMGHELRTPLHSLVTVSQFLIDRLDGDLTPEQDKQARLLHSIGSGLLEYVNDLLALSKTDAGKVVIHVSAVTVDRVLRTVRRMMLPLATNRAVTLRFVFPERREEMLADESKVSQILRNLVANALKFTEAGHVLVSGRTDRDRVVFEVEDTGMGIAAQHLDLIFEEFAQVEGPHQARLRGTGLGLPLSRRLAEVLGGSLTVTSKLTRGSRFRLDLPRIYAGESAPAPAPARASVVPVQPVMVKAHVLIIDDDEASRYVLRRWLEDRFIVTEAAGGNDGLGCATDDPPDAIFLDVVMHDLTGFEVLERLKAEPATAPIPVVVYTSFALGAGDRDRLQAAVAIIRKSTASRIADRAAVEQALVSAGLAQNLGAQP